MMKYPPTKGTWICMAKRLRDGISFKCQSYLSADESKCPWCGTKKPRKPPLLWPEYVIACEKAGVDPENPKGDADAGTAPSA